MIKNQSQLHMNLEKKRGSSTVDQQLSPLLVQTESTLNPDRLIVLKTCPIKQRSYLKSENEKHVEDVRFLRLDVFQVQVVLILWLIRCSIYRLSLAGV